jgi:hypothetical protein
MISGSDPRMQRPFDPMNVNYLRVKEIFKSPLTPEERKRLDEFYAQQKKKEQERAKKLVNFNAWRERHRR